MGLRFVVVPALSTLTLLAMALTVLVLVTLAMPAGRRQLRDSLDRHPTWPLAAGWLVALIATSGSLYLSEGMGLEPCELCWFQRIAMYPLVVVLGVALLRRDVAAWKTVMPLALLGAVVSIYHVMVQYNPALEVTACSTSAPCSTRYLVSYGFVSIPVMAGSAFLFVAALTLVQGRAEIVERDAEVVDG